LFIPAISWLGIYPPYSGVTSFPCAQALLQLAQIASNAGLTSNKV
jgi:hypothetical protein